MNKIHNWRPLKNILLDRDCIVTQTEHSLNVYECDECGYIIETETLPEVCIECKYNVINNIASSPDLYEIWDLLNDFDGLLQPDFEEIIELDILHDGCDCPDIENYPEVYTYTSCLYSTGDLYELAPICPVCNGCRYCSY